MKTSQLFLCQKLTRLHVTQRPAPPLNTLSSSLLHQTHYQPMESHELALSPRRIKTAPGFGKSRTATKAAATVRFRMKVCACGNKPSRHAYSSSCHCDSVALEPPGLCQPGHFKSLFSAAALRQLLSVRRGRCLEHAIPRAGCCWAGWQPLAVQMLPGSCSAHTMCDHRPWVHLGVFFKLFKKLRTVQKNLSPWWPQLCLEQHQPECLADILCIWCADVLTMVLVCLGFFYYIIIINIIIIICFNFSASCLQFFVRSLFSHVLSFPRLSLLVKYTWIWNISIKKQVL